MRQDAALAHKPAGVGFEEAAAVCDGVILALMGLRPAEVRKGRSILVYGASGSIGTAAVQLSRHFGADVTAVCGTKNLDLVRSLGADQVIDYTQEDFTTNGQRYDVIFDAVGKRKSARAMANSAAALSSGGVEMSVDDAFPRTNTSDLLALKQLAESGELRPVIDRRFTLDEIVEAHRYVDQGHKKGNVIIEVSPA